MSFSTKIKDELLARQNIKTCCENSKIASDLRVSGVYSYLLGEKVNVKIHNHSHEYSRSDELFRASGIVFGEKEPYFEQYLNECKKCCKKTYVKSAFIAGGSLSDPDKEYHLEIVCRDGMIAEEIADFLEDLSIDAKIVERKGLFVLYVKDGEQIALFLNYIGAHNSMMEFENVRILKEVRNNVNRQVNCETANIQKTVNASMRQIENIKFLIQNGKLENLTPVLRETAILRLENPEADLNELGNMFAKTIGKSGVNHRLRKIDEIANLFRFGKAN
ncbi:MAG: DNA-binding protein WhiA [Bacillota bacterium]